ncbi:hypothetical protein [Bradyrhizobium septentrionale]|uniref:Glycosyltransferase RgtA/B/C/D-like domain-containing protein n=1 Tax=Bradyrhizobium septentrionale TaxID=1404411 RepID=A0ABZ2NRK7_9BRAD
MNGDVVGSSFTFGTMSAGSRITLLWLAVATALSISLLFPLFIVDVPPIEDYPNHLARFFILAHPDDPILSKMYAPHWAVLPNLGMDLVGAGLFRVVDPFIGGKVLLALSLLAPIAGVTLYHRIAFGCVSYWPLASGLVAYNATFFLGFMNFLLSIGIAFAGAAIWISLRRKDHPKLSAVTGAIAATVAFFTHIFGLVFLFLLIGSSELADLRRQHSSGELKSSAILTSGIAMMAAALPAVIIYSASPFGGAVTAEGEWPWLIKALRLLSPFAVTSAPLMIQSAGLFVIIIVLVWRHTDFAPGAWLVFGALAVAYVAVPFDIKGGSFVDARVAVIFAFMLFAALNPRLAPARGIIVTVAIVALIATRVAFISSGWSSARRDVADVRAAISNVEPGARVLAVTGSTEGRFWEPENWILPGFYRLYLHLPALLVVDRRAFWPLLFASPTQQPVSTLPPFDRISQMGEPVDWTRLANEPYSLEVLMRARYLVGWRANFDYVLVVDAHPETLQISGLVHVHDGPFAKLFQIVR